MIIPGIEISPARENSHAGLVPLVLMIRQLFLRALSALRSQVFFGFSLLVMQFADEMTIHKLKPPQRKNGTAYVVCPQPA